LPWLGLLVYCGAKSVLQSALIARLAYGDLIDQPEDVKTATRQLQPRMWKLWLVVLLTSLILFGISLGLSIGQNIIQAGLVIAFRDVPLLLGLSIFALLIVYYVIYFWSYARLSLMEVPMAIEENLTVTEGVGRGWTLTQGHTRRVLLTLAVAFLITLPLYLLAFIPVFSYLPRLRFIMLSQVEAAGFVGALGLSVLFLFAISLATIPFWQAIKAAIYYDLRARREGLGLKLRDR
jgi:hypothetical protein